ncbi:hypothetical protein BWQ96_04770 [Gracilariopsis chorda]|uniref:Plastocyanin-like domain-containing protein n=1 Tax=Gracilariopsis chorda TaxID=448386 RepID=A0A2V3ITP6_9FLOR|nr:hypothetical protein BWQ96_04770 [Gracilariopsis chorda]|eukprot:PXF45472.1 hypothetical protein BWQ96_04770 [Gracilariopsis chorda]
MAPAVDLDDPASETTFPSWPAGTQTEVWVRNKSTTEDAQVKFQAGTHGGEDVSIAKGTRQSFRRDFGGLRFRVINNYGVPVQVWTV